MSIHNTHANHQKGGMINWCNMKLYELTELAQCVPGVVFCGAVLTGATPLAGIIFCEKRPNEGWYSGAQCE